MRGGVSRRRVIQGAAWVTPVVLVATGSPPAAASVSNPLDGTTVSPPVSQGNKDQFVVTVSLPEGVVLTGATFTLTWDATGSTNASAAINSGGVAWSPPSSSANSVVFTAPPGVVITDGSDFSITFTNGKTNTPWTGVLGGYVGDDYFEITLSGVL